MLRESPQDLVDMRRDHLAFDLLPMFQVLDRRTDPLHLLRPSEILFGRQPLAGGLNMRGDLTLELLLELGDGLTLSVKRRAFRVKRQFGQSDHPAGLSGHGVQRSVYEHGQPLRLRELEHGLLFLRAGVRSQGSA